MKLFFRFTLIILNLVALSIIWGVSVEPNLLITNKITIKVPKWHKEHNDLKIAVLTDMHLGFKASNHDRIIKIINKTNSQKPDIIFIVGDFDSFGIENYQGKANGIINDLKKLRAPHGVIAVLGNHDYYPVNYRSILKKAGIIVLEDDVKKITIKNKSFYVSGIRDVWRYALDIKRILRLIPSNEPAIMLAHNPDIFPGLPEKIELTLSGHNHGGVVYIPFVGGLFIPSIYNQRYVRGYVAEKGKQIFISRGIGTNHVLRLGSIPEILIIKMQKQVDSKKIPDTRPKKFTNLNFFWGFDPNKLFIFKTFWSRY